MCAFQKARGELTEVQKKMENMSALIKFLTQYFVEEEKTFKVEECFKILSTFVTRLKEAAKVSFSFLQKFKVV